jgi:hypothetical protein
MELQILPLVSYGEEFGFWPKGRTSIARVREQSAKEYICT